MQIRIIWGGRGTLTMILWRDEPLINDKPDFGTHGLGSYSTCPIGALLRLGEFEDQDGAARGGDYILP